MKERNHLRKETSIGKEKCKEGIDVPGMRCLEGRLCAK
jgi:hypothetical protein